MLVTESGIIMLVSAPQPLNAETPIFVTFFPIVTLVRESQLKNAEFEIVVNN